MSKENILRIMHNRLQEIEKMNFKIQMKIILF